MLERIHQLVSLFPHAVAGGIVIAVVCSLLGVLVILKRVVFIGITLSEVAACGVAASLVLGVPPLVGASVLTLATVALLAYPFETNRLPRDAILGVVFVLAAGLSILLVAKSGFGLEEVKGLLYGDLILTTSGDLVIILACLLPVLVYLLATLRPTVYAFADREAARVLGIRAGVWEMLYFLALGLTVSASSKVAGALLVFCYLVVVPSAALLLSRRLWAVMALTVAMAVAATVAGLYWSFSQDLPTNQSIAVSGCAWFAAALAVAGLRRLLVRRRRVTGRGAGQESGLAECSGRGV